MTSEHWLHMFSTAALHEYTCMYTTCCVHVFEGDLCVCVCVCDVRECGVFVCVLCVCMCDDYVCAGKSFCWIFSGPFASIPTIHVHACTSSKLIHSFQATLWHITSSFYNHVYWPVIFSYVHICDWPLECVLFDILIGNLREMHGKWPVHGYLLFVFCTHTYIHVI